jgi:hypothetical protein
MQRPIAFPLIFPIFLIELGLSRAIAGVEIEDLKPLQRIKAVGQSQAPTYEFTLLSRKKWQFRITNICDHKLALPSMLPDENVAPLPHTYSPALLHYQTLKNGNWITLPIVQTDGLIYTYELKPGKRVIFQEEMGFLTGIAKGTWVRLEVGNLISRPFKW